MTTPGGLLRWGQQGRYTAWDDRSVITALAGRQTGIVTPVQLSPVGGLLVVIAPGWLALADCGDATVAVLTSPVTLQVNVAAGGAQAREDEIWAEITDPEAAQYRLTVGPAGPRPGVMLATVRVPPGAASSEDMELIPRAQDVGTGTGPPGPQGPAGPQGPPGQEGAGGPIGPQGPAGGQGPPGGPGADGPPGPQGEAGAATLIVGSFGQQRTPADLPPDGFIEANWDGLGRPANDTQVQVGWSLVYDVDGALWTFTGPGIGGPWLSPAVVRGPPGADGAQGPQGPQGPQGDQGPPGEGGGGGAPGPWEVIPLTGGWAPAGTNPAPQIRLLPDGSNCQFTGLAQGPSFGAPGAGPANTIIAPVGAIPVYLRPSINQFIPGSITETDCTVNVRPDGSIYAYSGGLAAKSQVRASGVYPRDAVLGWAGDEPGFLPS
jgi:hypothetical protein